MSRLSNKVMSVSNSPQDSGVSRWLFLLSKLLEYVGRYSTNPDYLLSYLVAALSPSYKEKVNFLSENEFLALAKTRSTMRLGDGEIGLLISNRDIHFQKNDIRLRQLLLKAIKEYNDESPYLLGLPPFIIIDNQTLDKADFKYIWLPSKLLYRKKFPKAAKYFNSCYFYIRNTVPLFIEQVSADKHVVIVTNGENLKRTKLVEKLLFPKSTAVSYIEAPSKNAFDKFNELKDAIQLEASGKDCVVFMACGPAGKALIYDLSKSGLICHDLGHGLLFALNNEDKEEMIKWDRFSSVFEAARQLIK